MTYTIKASGPSKRGMFRWGLYKDNKAVLVTPVHDTWESRESANMAGVAVVEELQRAAKLEAAERWKPDVAAAERRGIEKGAAKARGVYGGLGILMGVIVGFLIAVAAMNGG